MNRAVQLRTILTACLDGSKHENVYREDIYAGTVEILNGLSTIIRGGKAFDPDEKDYGFYGYGAPDYIGDMEVTFNDDGTITVHDNWLTGESWKYDPTTDKAEDL